MFLLFGLPCLCLEESEEAHDENSKEEPPQTGECSRVFRTMKTKAEETVSAAQSSMGSGAQRPKNSQKAGERTSDSGIKYCHM